METSGETVIPLYFFENENTLNVLESYFKDKSGVWKEDEKLNELVKTFEEFLKKNLVIFFPLSVKVVMKREKGEFKYYHLIPELEIKETKDVIYPHFLLVEKEGTTNLLWLTFGRDVAFYVKKKKIGTSLFLPPFDSPKNVVAQLLWEIRNVSEIGIKPFIVLLPNYYIYGLAELDIVTLVHENFFKEHGWKILLVPFFKEIEEQGVSFLEIEDVSELRTKVEVLISYSNEMWNLMEKRVKQVGEEKVDVEWLRNDWAPPKKLVKWETSFINKVLKEKLFQVGIDYSLL